MPESCYFDESPFKKFEYSLEYLQMVGESRWCGQWELN